MRIFLEALDCLCRDHFTVADFLSSSTPHPPPPPPPSPPPPPPPPYTLPSHPTAKPKHTHLVSNALPFPSTNQLKRALTTSRSTKGKSHTLRPVPSVKNAQLTAPLLYFVTQSWPCLNLWMHRKIASPPSCVSTCSTKLMNYNPLPPRRRKHGKRPSRSLSIGKLRFQKPLSFREYETS